MCHDRAPGNGWSTGTARTLALGRRSSEHTWLTSAPTRRPKRLTKKTNMATPTKTATAKGAHRWAWLCGGVDPFPQLAVPPEVSAAV